MNGLKLIAIQLSRKIYSRILLSVKSISTPFDVLSVIVFLAQYLLYAAADIEDNSLQCTNEDDVRYEIGKEVAGHVSCSTLVKRIINVRNALMHIETTASLHQNIRAIMNAYGYIKNYGTLQDDIVVKHIVDVVSRCEVSKDSVCELLGTTDNKRSIGSLLKAAESSK